MPAWTRRRVVVLVAVALVLVLAVSTVLALPVVVRRLAVQRIAAMTGRAVTLEKVELNPFTGRVALNRFRLAQRGSSEPALELERLEVRVAPLSLASDEIRVKELTLTRPRLYVTRRATDRYDFSDLLDLIPPPDPNKKPSTR